VSLVDEIFVDFDLEGCFGRKKFGLFLRAIMNEILLIFIERSQWMKYLWVFIGICNG